MPPYVKPEVTTSKVNVTFAGKAEWERVDFTFTVNNDSHTVPTQLIIPKNKPNCPFIIYLNFESQVPSKYLP
ncbi:MAG: hypothetical protein IJA15_00675, partial [Clostridia bacterium]|nr:hypothetical protein [Clostridia bacterium]